MAGFDNMPASKMPQSGGQDFGPRNIVNAESTYQNPVKKNLGGSAVISEMFPTVGRAQEQEGGTTKVHHSPLVSRVSYKAHETSIMNNEKLRAQYPYWSLHQKWRFFLCQSLLRLRIVITC